jgi:hypothetical protein
LGRFLAEQKDEMLRGAGTRLAGIIRFEGHLDFPGSSTRLKGRALQF